MNPEWKLGEAPAEKLDVVNVSELRPNDTVDWHTEEELKEQNWLEEKGDKPFYPLPEMRNGQLRDGHHRASVAKIGDGKVIVEHPTKIHLELDDGREKTAKGFHSVRRNGEKPPDHIENRIEQIKEDCMQGRVKEARKEDGELLCKSDY